LLHARLTTAAAAGCDLATVQTAPGNASQRNVERLGFRLAYTKLALLREPDPTEKTKSQRRDAETQRKSDDR